MPPYDWIVVGAGLAGTAVSYELAKAGFSVLLLDQSADPPNATRCSYAGIAYWSGKTPLNQTLCRETKALYPTLADELGQAIEFRELDLLMAIAPDQDPQAIAPAYADCLDIPHLISAEAAADLEPLLDQGAIAAALQVKHGHVNPALLVNAYRQAFLRQGGTWQTGCMTGVVTAPDRDAHITGITTATDTYSAAHVLIAAGGWSRPLLKTVGISVPVYFTQAELIETPPLEDIALQTLVMPAVLQRFQMESTAADPTHAPLWDSPAQEVMEPILDIGAVQFHNGQIRIGQISRTSSSLNPPVDAATSEAKLRATVGHYLPRLAHVPGQWCCCPVAFSGDALPLVGPVPGTTGLQLFSGFSNPFVLLPPIARRFAAAQTGKPDDLLSQMAAARFAES
ncbi:MAG: FAD-binding oxidoreductase [Kaiparowitsia implicata GSE-PSE-MK54-09C]|jgi:glycine/D-amino acid oxidase-like deaminating enzyme|nr:FAD-binding oxidoreductase [Kaiparowitsia implicata GSE-PSE-MK54-09C]